MAVRAAMKQRPKRSDVGHHKQIGGMVHQQVATRREHPTAIFKQVARLGESSYGECPFLGQTLSH